MKTAKSIIILLASIAMLSAEDYGAFSGQTYESDAPNGRFSVRAHQEKGYYKFDVEIIETASHMPVLTFYPKARFIGAAWSPDSRLVAIEQNKSTHDSAVSVLSIAQEAAKGLGLPKECEDESAAAFESPTRKHAQKADSLKFHLTSEGLQIVKWLSPDELVLSSSGMGWWGGDAAEDKDTRFLAEYEITIHFATDSTSSLEKIALKKYEELSQQVVTHQPAVIFSTSFSHCFQSRGWAHIKRTPTNEYAQIQRTAGLDWLGIRFT
jgi:hypothetical protein